MDAARSTNIADANSNIIYIIDTIDDDFLAA